MTLQRPEAPKLQLLPNSGSDPESGSRAPAGGAVKRDPLVPHARAAVAGDTVAQRRLLTAVSPPVLRAIRKVAGTAPADLEDLLQDALVALVDGLKTFRYECTVLHFACRLGVLTALRHRRDRAARKRDGGQRADVDVDTVGAQGDAHEQLARKRAAAALRELLLELPEAQAEAVALHVCLGHTLEEVAEAAGVSRDTIKSRIRLAKQALRRKLEQRPQAAELVVIPGRRDG